MAIQPSPGAGTDQSHRAVISYALALLLGLSLAAWVFPLAFLFPGAPAFAPFIEGDMAQHVVGQRYFIADSWRWPLLVVPSLGAPDGVNIGLTDSIPLLALILKALAAWLPPGFHGIGLWYGIAWTLQPIAAVWCLRAAGERRVLPALCMAVLAVSIPAWWNRFTHAALTGHFLILFTLGTYLLLVRHGTVRRWCGAAALLGATILVHPYLMLMNAAVLAAVPVTLLLRRDRGRGWRPAALGTGLMLLGALLLLWSLGYLGTTGEGGFGRYAMNLLSPIWPSGSWLLGRDLMKIHAANVSGWEGYNYLGLGLLCGVPLAFLAAPRAALGMAKAHAGLLLALLALTLLALSNRVGVGYSRVIELFHAPAILESFRSSGRFFWPATYAMALVMVLGLSRIRAPWPRAALLLAVVALQAADTTAMRASLAAQLAAPPRPWKIEAAALRPVLAAHRALTILPRWDCLPADASIDSQKGLILEILTLASETVIPVNTMYEAGWHRQQSCDIEAAARETLRPGEVRVMLPSVGAALRPLVPDGDRQCRPIGELMVCGRD